MLANPTIRIYLLIAGGLLLFAGVAIVLLKFVLKKNAEHAWKSFLGWLIMIPLVIGAILLGREATILFLGIVAIAGFTELARATGLYRDWLITGLVYLGIGGVTLLTLVSPPGEPRTAGWYGMFMAIPVYSAIVVNAMPFDRMENPRESIDLCRELLRAPRHVLILFPEGTRSPTGELAPFKPGIGFLTAGTNTPVVPCYLDGAYRAWPKGAWIPRPRRLTVRIGAPLVFADVACDKEGARRVAAALEAAVKGLIGS